MSDLRTIDVATVAGPVRATYVPDVPPETAMADTNAAGEALAVGDEGTARELSAGFLRAVLVGFRDSSGASYPVDYEALAALDVRLLVAVGWAVSIDLVLRRPAPLTYPELLAKVEAEAESAAQYRTVK
jgi:hypothetical protein